jgi:uncharacterized protein (TIGR02217 family)
MSFHEVRFPTAIALGSSGGPMRRTEVVTLASGFEERNAVWAHSRRRYDAGYGVKTLDDLHAVIAFFEARMGRLHGFRWKDRADFKSVAPGAAVSDTDQPLGTGDGVSTDFPLVKVYSSGGADYARPIRKPVAASVAVAIDGAGQSEGIDFTLDAVTGTVSFAAPPAPGAVLTAGFEFDVPARFDTDRLAIDLSQFEAGMVPNIPILEVRL